MVQSRAYGTWDSPISAADTVGGIVDFGQIAADGDNLYWLEGRPSEGGRQVLVRRDDSGQIGDITPQPIYVRTQVHEYGGGAFIVDHGRVAYSELTDQRLYLLGHGPITPEPSMPGALRYADGRFLPDGSIVCVRESHGDGEAVNEIVRIDPDTREVEVLVTGRDFYASPRPSSDDTKLLWLEWDHPNMPWDGTLLKTGTITENGLVDIEEVAGGPDEAIFQPEWSPGGGIVFATDRSGWWNLHRFDGEHSTAIVEMEADFGVPLWIFGPTTFGFLSEGRILTAFWEGGVNHLGVVDRDGRLRRLPNHLTGLAFLVTDGESRAWFVGHGPATPSAVYELDVDTGALSVVRANPMPAEPDYIPSPRIITFPTADGEVAHGVYYPPTNPDFDGPDEERPPLIVKVHGGPTSHVFPSLKPSFLYWTTRGFGLVDVNYRGSTGYGRKFRNLLRDSWGIADVEDCLAAARYLAAEGEVDGHRLIITGGSAGGYTTLAALAFGDAFSAGGSYFGVADIGLLADHTHKFESRYLDGMVGTDPEEMRRRSPLYSVDQITVPVILFQGLDDKVVPPEQAELISAALAENGVPHAHITYEGEDHGFRKAENIIHSLESELAFYGRVFGFDPADDLPEVPLVVQPGTP
ncbi:MAG TPA: prolyl oligopeptidase family serine peptidase [Acidimicrobiia bacterium]|jgi:dipeptidyl aminopeptidase/acylaminoacyl peptidase|nr:prolyl oligopeptidase family serine peptidase [Acidimicrobiia bacterium]